ncbi:MAG: DUF4907 domain-containing protein [Chitinophagales bacterium]
MKSKLYLAASILFLLWQATFAQTPSPQPGNNSTSQFSEPSTYSNADLSYKIIDAANGTFCYDVYAKGRLMIHPPSTPGLPGNQGFKTKANAEKVALLVLDKIKKGEMPPTITMDEMNNLSVIK